MAKAKSSFTKQQQEELNRIAHGGKRTQVSAMPPTPRAAPGTVRPPRPTSTTPSALPPTRPPKAPTTYRPLIDPNRTRPGDNNRSALAKTTLPPWAVGAVRGAMNLLNPAVPFVMPSAKETTDLQLGDIFPNLQEAIKPIARPGLAQEEREASQGKQGTAAQKAAENEAHWNSIKDKKMGAGELIGTTLDVAGRNLDVAGTWLGENFGNVGKAVAGAPQTVMNVLSMPGQLTEQAIGSAAQAAGVAMPSSGQVILGGQTIPVLAKIGAALAGSVGAQDLAAELEKHTDAPPGVVASLVANVVARQRAAGQDSTMAEGILNAVMAPLQTVTGIKDLPSITGRPDAEQLIQLQAEALKGAGGMTPESWKASMFAGEGPQYVEEANRRLEAGEDWDVIYDDIQNKITPEARAYDFVGQMVLDPLNALEAVGGVGKLIGLGTRGERSAANAMRELVMATDEGAGLLKLAEKGGDVSNVGLLERKLRQVPVIGELLRPLPETIAARRGEEASAVIKMISQGISPDAPTRLLEAGIDQHPLALAMDAFVNHNATDLVKAIDKSGNLKSLSSADVQDLLGMGSRTMTDAEAAALKANPGSVMDMFRSNAADRARDWLAKSGDDAQKLADEFVEMQKYFSETMISKETKVLNAAGKEVIVKGNDAIALAEDKLIKWLENVNNTYMKAAGVPQPTGLYKKILWTRKGFGKIQAPFRFFHMGSNPGMSFRNLGTNTMLGWLDNFNMLTPVRATQVEIGRLGLSSGGMARQLGAQSDVVKGLRGGERAGVKGLLHKIDPMAWSQHFEDISGQRITLQAFQRHMGSNWKVGKAIPEDKWAEAATYFGDRADEARSLLEGAWAPGELQKVMSRMTNDPSWKMTVKKALDGTHDVDLVNDLDEIIQAAPTPEAAADLIEDYVQAGLNQFDEFLKRGAVMEGTPAAAVMEAAQMAVKGLPPKERAKYLSEFAKTLVKQDATVSLYRSYTNQVLEQLRVVDSQVWGDLETRAKMLEQSINQGKDNIKASQYPAYQAWQDKDWDQMRAIGEQWATDGVNPFSDVKDWQSARASYHSWIDGYWSDVRMKSVAEYDAIYKEAADILSKAGKAPSPVPVGLIEDFIPLGRAEQRNLMAQLSAMAQRAGIGEIASTRGIGLTEALRDVLKDEGVLHASRLFRADIQDKDWYKQAAAAIMRYSKKKGAAAKAAKEVVDVSDDVDDLSNLMRKFDLDPEDLDSRAMNQVDGMAAQMSERDAQVQKVLDGLRNPPVTPGGFDKQALEKLSAFIKEIEPRHVTTRAIGEQVATKARDFALLNYGDRRGIDLVAGFMFNYPKWYMGTMKNMLGRALENPGRLAALIKFRQQLRTINRDLPEWWQDQISLKTASGSMYFNLLASIDPLNGFLGDKYRDPDMSDWEKHPLSALMSEAQQYGPGLHGTWSSIMALAMAFKGDREASMGWIGNLGPATRGITAITALAKDKGLDFLPAGGIVMEPWLWGGGDVPGEGMQMIGTKHDAKRIGLSLAEMVDTGEITAEEAYDAMLSERGPIFDRALQMSKVKTSKSVIRSWLFGAGTKDRSELEIDVQRMDADRIALMRARDDGFYDGRPEAWRAAWEEMRETYRWMDFVQGFRRDETGRANIYSMSVYDRMPPNPRPYIDALMGGETEIYNELLDKFYGNKPGQKPCRIENMTQPEQEMFMSMMKMMGAVLALPSDATGNEWNMARQARSAMYQQLDRKYSGIDEVQTEYYNILNSGGDNAAANARTYLDQHGELQAFWDDKDRLSAADPLLTKYWGSMALFERVSRDEFERKMAVKYPGLSDQLDEYYRLKDTDPDQAKTYLKTHESVTNYWSEKDKWVLGLDKELMGMTGGITNLQGQWGQLRQGVEPQMEGQQRVVDLIESGSRPMGDFELPEDLDARQVQSGIQDEIDTYIKNGGKMGDLYRQLRAMGGLDKTLTAFQEFGRGAAGPETVMANLSEVKALLTALSSMNEGTTTAGGAGGGAVGGTTTNTRQSRVIRSRNYGGASSAPKPTEKQQAQVDNRIDGIMAQIQEKQPKYWGTIYNMTSMDQAGITALLESDPGFRAFLASILSQTGFTLQQMIDYFKRLDVMRAKVSPRAKRP